MLNPLYDWLLKAIANLKHQPFSTQKQGVEIISVENQAEIASWPANFNRVVSHYFIVVKL